jgi:predicted O-linked N-acetylglucosamine transferase (SPINDLY family)
MSAATVTDLLSEALSLHRDGAFAEAAERYAAVLRIDPNNPDAHYYLATLACQAGRFDEGVDYLRKSLASEPDQARGHILLGRALGALGRHEEALASFDRAIAAAAAETAKAQGYRADLLGELGRHAEAVEAYDRALAVSGRSMANWFDRGVALAALSRFEAALESFDRAIELEPDYAPAIVCRAKVLADLHRDAEAAAGLEQALKLAPDDARVWLVRGQALAQMRRSDEAAAAFGKALELDPGLHEAWLGRAELFGAEGRLDDAVAAYSRALQLRPDLAEAYLGRGNVLLEKRRLPEADRDYDSAISLDNELAEAWLGKGNVAVVAGQADAAMSAYDRALAIKPDLAQAWLGRSIVLHRCARLDDALKAVERALELKPDLAQAWQGLGGLATELKDYPRAVEAYDKALEIRPHLDHVAGARLNVKLQMCDWTNLDAETEALLREVRSDGAMINPHSLFLLQASPQDQLQCARKFARDLPQFAPLAAKARYDHPRLKIAYLSADFADHPVGHLTVALAEHHDRSRFEATAVSLGPPRPSAVRRRLESAFEQFVDMSGESDTAIAAWIRNAEIDIAVDLTGSTAYHRLGVLARRPAPVQVSYLGYAGTLGADFVDYILAIPDLIPAEDCRYYSERVVWLPRSYFVTDDQVSVPLTPSRQDCGLPRQGFVFCAFNNPVKFNPEVFSIWMRLLRAVEGSVLWLSDANAPARASLCRYAASQGVAPERLIFAPRVVGIERHFARQPNADLFLDTLPYNAHATAIDALRAGVPILTCTGTTFAGRVAGSLLKLVGLDELITPTLAQYETLALELATRPAVLKEFRDRLDHGRATSPLFDTAAATRGLEAAFSELCRRHRNGLSAHSDGDKPIVVAESVAAT